MSTKDAIRRATAKLDAREYAASNEARRATQKAEAAARAAACKADVDEMLAKHQAQREESSRAFERRIVETRKRN